MDHSLVPFVVMMAIILCGCAPLCSSKRCIAHGPTPSARPPSRVIIDADFSKDAPCAQMPIRSGDIVFIAVPNYLFRQVSTATQCPANHVGIIFHDAKKGWLVAESSVPLSRYTTLEKFMARSDGGWCVIRRLRTGLTDSQVAALRAQCDARMNMVYHTGFRYESHRMFCSKFVYDVYRSALGIDVGELETFEHLLDRNPQASLAFWRVWFFGKIPWDRITVTPASQFESGLLKTAWQSPIPNGDSGRLKAAAGYP